MRFEDKVAIVTGASRGMGRAIAATTENTASGYGCAPGLRVLSVSYTHLTLPTKA